jgi:hypothetical protein
MSQGPEANDAPDLNPAAAYGVPEVPDAWREPVIIGAEGVDEPITPMEDNLYGTDRFGPVDIGVEEPFLEIIDHVPVYDDPETTVPPAFDIQREIQYPQWRRPLPDLGIYMTFSVIPMPQIEAGQDATDSSAGDPADDTSAPAADDAPAPDAPAATDGPGDVPPELPPLVTTGEGEPNRGEAVKDVIMYTAGVNPDITSRAHMMVLDNADSLDIPGYMEEMGFDNIGDAVDSLTHVVPDETGTSIRAEVITDELATAERLYADRLEAAGLKLGSDGEEIRLDMTDPAYFTEAIGQMSAPANPDEQTAFNDQIQTIIDGATLVASGAIIADHPDAAEAAVQWNPPPDITFTSGAVEGNAIPEDRGMATSLAENAATLAANLEAHGTPPTTVDPVRQLAIAHAEGLTTEWAVGCALEIIARSHTPIGVDRVSEPEEWSTVYSHLEHLAITAPNAEYTREVRDTLLRDIDTTLAGPGQDNEHQRDLFDTAAPLLREAQARIRDIL